MGCMRSQFKYIDSDGNKHVDTKYSRDKKAHLLSPTTGMMSRSSGSIHRQQRKGSQLRPEPDFIGLQSPAVSPRQVSSPNSNRHRRAASLLLRRFRALCKNFENDDHHQTSHSDRFSNIEKEQREALHMFGRAGKTALHLMITMSEESFNNMPNRKNGFFVNMCWTHFLTVNFTTGELANANVHVEILLALAQFTPEDPCYPSITMNSLLLLTKMTMSNSVDFESIVKDSSGENAANVLRALEWCKVNCEITDRILRCYCEDVVQQQQTQQQQTQQKKKKKRQKEPPKQKYLASQRQQGFSTSPEIYRFPASVGKRAVALRKMSGSAYYERKRRDLPKFNKSSIGVTRKERHAIQIMENITPFMRWIPNETTDELGSDGIEFVSVDILNQHLEEYKDNERLVLHVLLEILDELEWLSWDTCKNQPTKIWEQRLSATIVAFIRHGVVTAAKNGGRGIITSHHAIMAVAASLEAKFPFNDNDDNDDNDDDNDDNNDDNNNNDNDDDDQIMRSLQTWKLRNPLSADILVQKMRGALHATISSNVMNSSHSSSPLSPKNQQQSNPSPIYSPLSEFGIKMSTQFAELQNLVDLQKNIDPNLLDRILVHASTVIEDVQSSDDNKFEVATFMLDVLSVSRECRKLMRLSEHWTAVEAILQWCHCNDILLLQAETQSLVSIRSAGLHRHGIMMEKSLASSNGNSRPLSSTTRHQSNIESKYAIVVEDTPESLFFQEVVKEWSMLDQVCRKSFSFANGRSLDDGRGRKSTSLSDWRSELKRAGEVVARASLDGPIGLVDVLDFHSGNLYVLERCCTLLTMDGCSPQVLVASGFVEVAARSLRKSRPAHPFFLTALVKTTTLLNKAFEKQPDETTRRIFKSECDGVLRDCLSWADSNAGVFLPVLKNVVDTWTLSMRPTVTLLVSVKMLCSESVGTCCAVNPQKQVLVLQTRDGWVKIRTIATPPQEGWLRMAGFRRACLKRREQI